MTTDRTDKTAELYEAAMKCCKNDHDLTVFWAGALAEAEAYKHEMKGKKNEE